MDYLPIFMNLRDAKCVVVGGGAVARRKVDWLLRAGGRVTVVAPALEPELAGKAERGNIQHESADFSPDCLEGARLAIAATDNRAVNDLVSQEASRRGIPINVVDDPTSSTFIMPAIVDRSPVVIAVSSGGKAPVLARLIRARLEQAVSQSYGRLAGLSGEFRARVKARLPDAPSRNRFWENVFQGPVADLAMAGRESEAAEALAMELETAARNGAPVGSVMLVGAGPGDPELLTLRAARMLQEADVIVHDRLVSAEILDMARRDAERIDVGKVVGHTINSQLEINELLIRLAKQGKRVVRLKGGDPFIFGRGGEEQTALAEAGIRCDVVPGISAAIGCAARFGIPLTHREHAQSLVLATGHPQAGGNLNLPTIGPGQTLVVYMGLSRLAEICTELLTQGLSPHTPVALVQEGTTRRERMVTGILATIAAQAAAEDVLPPALLFVGDVVKCYGSMGAITTEAAREVSIGSSMEKSATYPQDGPEPFTLG